MSEQPFDSTQDTLDHINKVRRHILESVLNLTQRGTVHDFSKLIEPEKSGYDQITFKLKDIPYGSPEYKESLSGLRPTIEHHYKNNSHHPEHYENGIDGMSLFDLIEMLCDWKAAGERVKEGSIWFSIEHNRERFKMSDQLYEILKNTAKEMGWEK